MKTSIASREKTLEKYRQHMADYPGEKVTDDAFKRTPLAVEKSVSTVERTFQQIDEGVVRLSDFASNMVTSGIYRFSRNPMYLGFFLALAGWATYLSHLLAFALLPLFVLYINRFQILPEERALSDKFPQEYTAYKGSVRRWL